MPIEPTTSPDHASARADAPAAQQPRGRAMLDAAAELQLQQSRSRTARPLCARERRIEYPIAAGFLVATAALILLFPENRDLSLPVALASLIAYSLTARVQFEVGPCYTVPTQLVLVPMLFVLPVTVVPVVVALGLLLGEMPDFVRGRRHPERAVIELADSWHALGPALVLAAAGSPAPDLGQWPILLLALGAQFAVDVAINTPREWLEFDLSPREQLHSAGWTFGIDALLSPIGLLAAAMAVESALAFLLVMPLVALIAIFADERRARLGVALELSDAYRGTTMALADVLDSDHEYTGSHSRMVVSLTRSVAAQIGLDAERQRLAEFGALLHDIGKVAVPNEVINKPGPLSPSEWELIKLHTVKGQEILDRVGGVLAEVGKIVRSSHERWDGNGYPDGLAGEAIPLESRIISCCDAFNAMTTDRPYRRAMSVRSAIAEVEANSGSQFDPAIATTLIGLMVDQVASEAGLDIEAQAPDAARPRSPAFG